jgi:hypothetical protein
MDNYNTNKMPGMISPKGPGSPIDPIQKAPITRSVIGLSSLRLANLLSYPKQLNVPDSNIPEARSRHAKVPEPGQRTAPQNFRQSHGVVHASGGSHSQRRTCNKPRAILFDRTDGTRTPAGTWFCRIGVSRASDMLRPKFLRMRGEPHPIN